MDQKQNEIAVTIDYRSPEVLAVIKQTVAVGATDAELAMFVEHCRATGLNPFKREVWFVKQPGYTRRDGQQVEGRVQIMTGIGGYLAVANAHPMYDGMETVVERDDKGFPVRAIARVHRKDRKFPSEAEALWIEDSQPTESSGGKPTIWGRMRSTMLLKVAKSRALREAFPQQLNGTYTAEEMPSDFALGVQAPPPALVEIPVAGAWKDAPRPANTIVSREWRYDLAKIDEEKREAAIEYLESLGAALDPDTGNWVAKKEAKRLRSALVADLGDDDLPAPWGSDETNRAAK
jgi:phage recombination protein Bet